MEKITKIEPLFKHDCKSCVFLGVYKNRYDLYLHWVGTVPVFIARLGDAAQSVVSTFGTSNLVGAPFQRAYELAMEQGLLSVEKIEA